MGMGLTILMDVREGNGHLGTRSKFSKLWVKLGGI